MLGLDAKNTSSSYSFVVIWVSLPLTNTLWDAVLYLQTPMVYNLTGRIITF